jgi:hypothetical protein
MLISVLNVNKLQGIENKIRKVVTTLTCKLSYETLESLNVLLLAIAIFSIKVMWNRLDRGVMRALESISLHNKLSQ